jgi:autophagy-related protein 101
VIMKDIPDRQAFDANLASALTNSLQTMLTYTSSDRGRLAVPLITEAQSISPFPIKMVVQVAGVDVG